MKNKRRKPTAAQMEKAKARRAALCQLSRSLQKQRDSGVLPFAEFATLNECLVTVYTERCGQSEWRTFRQWRERGCRVRKGEEGFPVWGEPIKAKAEKAEQENSTGEQDEFRYFPVCYLFHRGQVDEGEGDGGKGSAPVADGHTPAPRGEPPARNGHGNGLLPGVVLPATRQSDRAAKLRKLADSMTAHIEAKANPAIAQQNPTRRRLSIAEGMRREAEGLRQCQQLLYRLAEAHEAGTVPAELEGIASRKAALEVLQGWKDKGLRELAERFAGDGWQEAAEAKRLRDLESSLVGLDIPGFHVTPDELAVRLIIEAGVAAGHTVLEPSAGAGHIADQMPDGADVSCIEINHRLREILTLRGHRLLGDDFLQFTGSFDRIVMNPPFERLADIDHVRHAFDCLRPGGRMVSVMSPAPFFRSDRKAVAFRRWLEEVAGFAEDLPANSFAGTVTSTGVGSRFVVIDK